MLEEKKTPNSFYTAAVQHHDILGLGQAIFIFKQAKFLINANIDVTAENKKLVQELDDFYQTLFNEFIFKLLDCYEMKVDHTAMKGIQEAARFITKPKQIV